MPARRVARRSPTPERPRRQWRQPPTRIYAPGTREWAEREEAQTRRAESAVATSRTRPPAPPVLRLSPEPRNWQQQPTRIWAPGEREQAERDAQLEREREEEARRREQKQLQDARAASEIRPLQERDKDLFRQLLGNKPVYNDSFVRRHWGHMEAVWEEAVVGYRWNWRPGRGVAPYKVPVTAAYVRILVQHLQWISRTHMKDLV
ncbi:hypothetical protein AURDEDRAFT_188487 [Auricularia subglabra TFB-10046 SS5]|nr:hypothetical protein AURDEDRAFT_188487 [Auricularia subglabra TFB-10046 SS5]